MSNISRRDFMKTAGVMTLAVAASAALAGCSTNSDTPLTPTTEDTTYTNESPYANGATAKFGESGHTFKAEAKFYRLWTNDHKDSRYNTKDDAYVVISVAVAAGKETPTNGSALPYYGDDSFIASYANSKEAAAASLKIELKDGAVALDKENTDDAKILAKLGVTNASKNVATLEAATVQKEAGVGGNKGVIVYKVPCEHQNKIHKFGSIKITFTNGYYNASKDGMVYTIDIPTTDADFNDVYMA